LRLLGENSDGSVVGLGKFFFLKGGGDSKGFIGETEQK